MNGSIFWRLFWKEYRLQRPLWIAMAVLTALLLLLFGAFAMDVKERTQGLFLIAVTFPALYAMGCGALLFAGEREAETYEFQRMLPVVARCVFFAKIALALIGMAALSGLVLSLAAMLNGWRVPDTRDYFILWATGSFFGLEMFLWATLFSLLSKRVLVAAILGVAAASISVQNVVEFVYPINSGPSLWRYWDVMPQRMVVAAIVALVDCWLAGRWFRQPSDRRLRSAPADSHATPRQATAFSECFRAPERMKILGRLVWQHWNQSFWLIVTVVAMLVPLAVVGLDWLLCAALTGNPWQHPQHCDQVTFQMAVILALMSVPLFGLCTFLPDQWGRSYRFLADRGVTPKYVWLSRQLMTLFPLLFLLAAALVTAILLAALLLPLVIHQPNPLELLEAAKAYEIGFGVGCLIVGFFGYVALCLAVGQLAAMFFRSGILAGIFSIPMSSLLVAWCGLMLFWGVNWLWSAVPIPLALLLATRLRARDWLLERNTCRAWLLPGLALVLPTVALLTAVPLYRIYQIPAVDPGFSVAEYDRPMSAEEKATRELYRQAIGKLDLKILRYDATELKKAARALGVKSPSWVDTNRETIALAIKASRGQLFMAVTDAEYWRRNDWRHNEMPRLLLDSAAQAENEGQLDTALEQYLAAIRILSQFRRYDVHPYARGFGIETEAYSRLCRWATRPHQTPARIIAALRDLQQATRHVSLKDPMATEYLRLRRVLEGDPAATYGIWNHDEPWPLRMTLTLWLQLPWERARALRLLNLMTHLELAGARPIEPDWPRKLNAETEKLWRETEPFLTRMRERELLTFLRGGLYLTPISDGWEGWESKHRRYDLTLAENFQASETACRATRIVLSLEAWRLQHGSLPKSLDELVGPFLDRLPVDPYSGEPFRYVRDGLQIPLNWRQPLWSWPQSVAGGTIPAGTPFIWSTGSNVRQAFEAAKRKDIVDKYELRSGGYQDDRWRWPNSEYDVWEAGWPFPIPGGDPGLSTKGTKPMK